MRLQNQVAIITGASRGIGRGIALRFASEGATVIVNYVRSKEGAEGVVSEINNAGHGRAESCRADVSSVSEVVRMMDLVFERYGKIDILVNNAGITVRGKIRDISESDWDSVINVNLKGTFLCSKYAAEKMLANEYGNIVNIASMRGITGSSSSMHYAASKGGVITLTKCLALELAPRIRVNCIAPGYTFTDLHSNKTKEQIADIETGIPLGRFGTVEDIAGAAVFFASRDSGFVTGETLVVSGGEVMH